MKHFRFFAILILLFAGSDLFAQTAGSPQNSLLPEINPQDIEIRSEFRARFPGLRRQPILGFNPTPRVFRIDPDRMPFMETPEEAVAAISASELDRPVPPKQNILNAPARTKVFLKAGVGSFVSPEAEAYLMHQVNTTNFLSADLNLHAGDSHLSYQESRYRLLNLNALYSAKVGNRTRASFRGGVFSDFNDIFDLSVTVPSLDAGTAKKDYTGANFSVLLNGNKNAVEGWKYYLNLAATSIDMESPYSFLEGSLSEQSISTGFEKNWAGSKLNETFALKIDADAGNYSHNTLGNTQWVNAGASVAYNTLINYNIEVSLSGGAGFITDGVNQQAVFLTDSKIRHNLNDKIALKGAVYARPVVKTAMEHNQVNRFLNVETQLQYEYIMGVEGGVELTPFKATKIFGVVSYERINNKAYFSREERDFSTPALPNNLQPAYYNLLFHDADIFELKAGITQQVWSDVVWFDGAIYARRPKLENSGDIPFEERLGADAAFNIKPAKFIKIISWAEYIGERENSVNSTELKGYLLVNAGVELNLSSKFGVYAKLLNLLGSDYEIWDGYRERPFQAFGGIKLNL